MTSALTFPSTTKFFSLPMLFAGQAQKEFFVNQSFAMIDGLLQLAIDASLPDPPVNAEDGETFRILPQATGEWVGQDDKIAIKIAGGWNYFEPNEGMRVFDRTADRFLLFRSSWIQALAPAVPSGGQIIDSQARAAIEDLIQALRNAGIFAAS